MCKMSSSLAWVLAREGMTDDYPRGKVVGGGVQTTAWDVRLSVPFTLTHKSGGNMVSTDSEHIHALT